MSDKKYQCTCASCGHKGDSIAEKDNCSKCGKEAKCIEVCDCGHDDCKLPKSK